MMRVFSVLFTKYYPADQIKKNDIYEAYRTHGDRRDAYRVLVGKPEGKKTLGRPGYTRENNIKMDFKERGWRRRLD